MLLAWDRIARYFRWLSRRYRRRRVSLKDLAFREVYGELIRQTLESHLPDDPLVLKTDLWNEGVEVNRNLAEFVHLATRDATLVGVDVSRTVCEYARDARNCDVDIVRATLLASPFRGKFDFVIDVSTVDHMSERLRERWISAESSLLKENGILLISFDSRLSLFTEVFHKLFTRKLYPEWTLRPASVRLQLTRRGFRALREHALFIVGLFLGTHRPWFPLARLLRRRAFFEVLKSIELSKHSRLLSFLAPQYAIVAVKAGSKSSDDAGRTS